MGPFSLSSCRTAFGVWISSSSFEASSIWSSFFSMSEVRARGAGRY